MRIIKLILSAWLAVYPFAAPGGDLTLAGRWPYGPAAVVTLDSSCIYAGSGSVIEILSASKDDYFAKIGEISLANLPEQIEIKDSLLFVLNNAAEFEIYNIKDKTNPFEISRIGLNHYTSKFFIKDAFVYFAADSFGLMIADLTTISAPVIAGSYETSKYVHGVAVKDSIAYLGLENSGIIMLNIKNPAAVNESGIFQFQRDNSYYAVDLQVRDDKLYAVSRPPSTPVSIVRSIFSILDVHNPASPLELSTLVVSSGDMYSWLRNVFVEDSLVYLLNTTDTGDFIQIVNISDSLNPAIEHAVEMGDPRDIFVENRRCYTADGRNGLKVSDYISAGADSLVYHYQSGGVSQGLFVKNNHAFIACGGAGLMAVDVSNLHNPQSAGAYAAGASISDAALQGDFAYCVIPGGLSIADISDPADMREVSSLILDLQYRAGLGKHIFTAGDYAYITHNTKGAIVVNISDAQNPQFAVSLEASCLGEDIFIQDTLLYLACGSGGVKIFAIADLLQAHILSQIPTSGGALSVFIRDNRLYVGEEGGLEVFDVSDIESPHKTADYLCDGSFTDVKVNNNYAYIADSKFGLRILNVQQSDSLFQTDIYRTNDEPSAIYLQDDLIYLTDSSDGLYIFKYLITSERDRDTARKPLKFRLMQNYPNPFNPQTKITYTLPRSSRVTIKVYNILGEMIEILVDEMKPAGKYETVFDAQGFASGIYYYRLITPDYAETMKMIKIQ